MQTRITWRELLIRFSLIFICLGLWRNELNLFSLPLLGIAWLLDGGLHRFNQTIKEPLVQAVLILSVVLLLGLLWSDYPPDSHMKWLKYFILLIFIPVYSLMNKERLPWVIGALLTGYIGVLVIGIFQWLVMDELGVPLLRMSYLSFSAMLGTGVIMAVYLAAISRSTQSSLSWWIVALLLLFIQFNQYGRGLLLATLGSVLLLVFLYHKIDVRKLMGVFAALMAVVLIFSYASPAFQDRLSQVKRDMDLLQQGNYSTSIGYRLAMWDVGLHGIAERPLLGHGTGMSESYFEKTVLTYKGGIYKDLPEFQKTYHYHNDWIEIGMHTGAIGIAAFAFFLWGWYQTFKVHHFSSLGAAIVGYIFLAGLADAFMIQSRIPVLLLVITAIVTAWYREKR